MFPKLSSKFQFSNRKKTISLLSTGDSKNKMSGKSQLLDMGFDPSLVDRAINETKSDNVEILVGWITAHQDDAPSTAAPSLTLAPTTTTLSTPADSTPQEEEIEAKDLSAQSLQCNDCGKLLRNTDAAQIHAERTQHQNFTESTDQIKPLTEEEKIEKLAMLKERLAAKRAMKAEEEKEENKQREKVRRKTGREIQEAKEKLHEAEIKKSLVENKREKDADKAARGKIKAQIEQVCLVSS
jgi:hypothetical protein